RLFDDVAHHAIDTIAAVRTEGVANFFRNVGGGDDAGADAVVDVVVDVRDDVGDANDVAFECERARLRTFAQQLPFFTFRMFEDAVAHFDGEIESASVVLELFDDAHRLPVV